MIPTSLAQILDLIRANGDLAYAFVLSYAAANSLIGVLLAGYAAALGALDWGRVFLVCWAGGFLGDTIRFFIGRRFGPGLLKRIPRFAPTIMAIARLVERYLVWVLIFHRYPHGIRGAAGFACGIANVPFSSFLALNAVSAGLWAGLISGAGYGFGQLSEKMLTDAASGLGLVSLVAFVALFWLLSRKLEQAIESEIRK
jgi:membrane protein DedA with SNARE-associated domain